MQLWFIFMNVWHKCQVSWGCCGLHQGIVCRRAGRKCCASVRLSARLGAVFAWLGVLPKTARTTGLGGCIGLPTHARGRKRCTARACALNRRPEAETVVGTGRRLTAAPPWALLIAARRARTSQRRDAVTLRERYTRHGAPAGLARAALNQEAGE